MGLKEWKSSVSGGNPLERVLYLLLGIAGRLFVVLPDVEADSMRVVLGLRELEKNYLYLLGQCLILHTVTYCHS